MSLDFAEVLPTCATIAEVSAAFGDAILRHGYSASAGRVALDGRGGATRMLFRNWPTGWSNLSDSRGYSASSIMFAAARRRARPFTWAEARHAVALTGPARDVWDLAADWGWQDGLVVPLHGPRGSFAMISMATRETDLDPGPAGQTLLRMLAVLGHERMLALSGTTAAASPQPSLSPRERDCLRWIADGKTDWEIGQILSISATTVKFHADGARRKLGARTRAQAVARLILSGQY
jgi:LuxR family quorum sensing-dependent transcriptional regulator